MELTPARRPARSGPHLRLLGRFELSVGSSVLSTRPSGERLLAYLAVKPAPVNRLEAASALWPHCTGPRAAANLRSVLWRLPGGSRVVRTSRADLALRPDVSVDIEEISGQLARCPAVDEDLSISTLRQDVLPGWPEEWLVTTREWFRQVRLRALETLCDQHRAEGRMDSALTAGMAALACDPLRESTHRYLALVHIADGNYAEALRQYHTYRRLVRTELGLPPSPQFRKLIAPLLGRPLDATA